MSKRELFIIGVLSLFLFVVWIFVPVVQVSGETTTRFETRDRFQKSWYDGIGSKVTVSYVPAGSVREEQRWAALADRAHEYAFFWLELEEKPGPNFLMVDLPYAQIFLQDDRGREYRLLNAEIARLEPDQDLRSALTVFDLTLFNNAFPDGPTLDHDAKQEGPLLFEPLANDARGLRLNIKYCMTGKPMWRLVFEFEPRIESN